MWVTKLLPQTPASILMVLDIMTSGQNEIKILSCPLLPLSALSPFNL
jgi:hypothetical protein